jgi:putative ABC transport system permease protein
VTPGYFETLGYRRVAGRTFTEADRAIVFAAEGDEVPVVINEALAARYFPGEDPLGRLLTGGFGARERIVGVVGDAAEARLADAPAPARYWLADHVPFGLGAVSFVLRAAPERDPVPARASARRGGAPGAGGRRARGDDDGARARPGGRAGAPGRAAAVAAGGAGDRAGRGGSLRCARALRRPPPPRLGDPHGAGLRAVAGGGPRDAPRRAAARAQAWRWDGCWRWALGRLLGALLYGVGSSDPLSLAAAGATLSRSVSRQRCCRPGAPARTPPSLLLREG